jgi:hypothetical protein
MESKNIIELKKIIDSILHGIDTTVDPILCNGFSCRSESTADPILAVTDLGPPKTLSNQILVLGKSQTKTSTKTHLAKSRNKYPKDCLLVQNLNLGGLGKT